MPQDSAIDGAEVYVTGCGLISPLGRDPDDHLSRLHELGFGLEPRPLIKGNDGIREPCDCHPLASRELDLPVKRSIRRFLSGAGQMFVRATADAIEQSGLAPEDLGLFGISVGVSNSDRPVDSELGPFRRAGDKVDNYYKYLLKGGASRALSTQPGMLGGVTSIWLGTTGPTLVFINPGIAGAIAFGEAFRSVASGECPGYVTGGAFDLDDPWIVLSRNTDEWRTVLPLMSGAGSLVMESADGLLGRRGTAMAEVLAYSEKSAEHVLATLTDDVAVCVVLAACPRAELSLGENHGDAEFIEIATDFVSAGPPILIALAANALGRIEGGEGRRPAALISAEYDACGPIHIVIAKPAASFCGAELEVG